MPLHPKSLPMEVRYLVYDVFTQAPFGGNPLAVFPEAQSIPEDLLLKITREFKYSEVVFLYPPDDPLHTAKVRIFTPNSEVPFAGHPVIGTLHALSDLGYASPMTLELGIGSLKGGVEDGLATFTATQLLDSIAEPETARVAACLSLSTKAVKTSVHTPQQLSLGMPFVCVELVDLQSLQACTPNIPKIKEAARLYPVGHDFAIFAYVRDGSRIRSRMFAPLDDIMEDAATGSASATLGAFLSTLSQTPEKFEFRQGDYIGRPSRLYIETEFNPSRVRVGGYAVKQMAGTFYIAGV